MDALGLQHGSESEAQPFRAKIDTQQRRIDAVLGDESARIFDRRHRPHDLVASLAQKFREHLADELVIFED
jgi:hypothetical protein